jgi:phosphoglycolate phosphatase-like HAD superfamily hydrolase
MRTRDGRSFSVRNIIWDVDGTLFDTYPAIAGAFKAALNDLGHDAALDRIAELARESLGHCATTLAAECQVDLARFETAFARQYEAAGPDAQPPFPGAERICGHVCRIGGQNLIVTHRGPNGTAELLSASGLAAFFSGSITHADGYPRKPDPAAFNAIIERHGLNRDETLAIGDRDIDIQAGQAAGVFTCLFGSTGAADDADLAITDLRDLARLLEAADR